VPPLRELCLDRVGAEPAASLASIARGQGWRLLPTPLRLQLLGALGERHALSDALLERLLPAGSVAQPAPAPATLCLAECAQVTERGLGRVAERCPELAGLSLLGLSVADPPLALLGMCCTQLRSLCLARCRRVSEGCVAQLCMSLPRLQSLDLSHCRQLGDVAAAAALRHCAELHTLWVDGTRVRGERPDPDDPGRGVPGAGPTESLGTGAGMPRPTTASSRPSTAARQPAYEPQGGGWAGLPGLRSMTSLSLQGCRLVSEGSLCALCADAPHLEHLWLGGTPAAERTLEAVAESLPGLRCLSLRGCTEMGDGALPLLLLGCPALQALDLSRCVRVEHLTFHHSSHSLLELQLGHCAQLSRDAISAIAESCEALLALALLACAQLDDALLLELGTGCTRLQRLHLQQCELISERGAFYAATSCRELRELRLCGCVQLTDEEALQATHGCSSLCALELPSGKMADLLAGII